MRCSTPRLFRLLVTFMLTSALTGDLVARGQDASSSDPDIHVDPTRFEVSVLATGLIQPMEVEVAPDGTIYFIELAGLLKKLDPKTNAVSQIGELKITTEQENGLLGLALDPNFMQNQWIYVQYSPPDFSGQHVSRFTLVDGMLDLTTEKLLFKYEEQRKTCCHHAGALEFGPNGDLYFSTGDNTNPFEDSQGYAPIDERPDRKPWDAQGTSANTRSANGKVLRIRPLPDGTYEIPDGNLFPKDGSQGLPEIYVMGCRNPWRISVDQKTGWLYWGDVGPDAGGENERGPRGHDEVNQARQAGFFGWPYFNADNQAYADVDFATGKIGPRFEALHPINESVNNTGIRELPSAQPAMIYYPSAPTEKFPELASGGRTACAGPVWHMDESLTAAGRFPKGYDRCLFIYEWSRNWIKVVHLDENGHVAKIEPFMPGQKFVRPVDMTFGPEGSLYVLEYGETWGVNTDARLIRIDYMRGNRSPVVVASTENNIGKAPLQVTLSSKGTFDKDSGDSLSYEWRLINTADPSAAPQKLSTEASPVVTIDRTGVFNAELVVTDAHGASRAASVPVLVGNARPEIQFKKPQNGDFYDTTSAIRYELIVKDVEDGTNDDVAIDEHGANPLDPDSPGRVSVNALFSTGPIPGNGTTAEAADQGPAGMRRMKGSDCFNCHAVDQKRVGPPLIEIANKYRGKDDALEASVQRVMKGSTGVWGKVPMIPHGHHSVEEVREMVGWIYSLQPAGLVRVIPGFVNEVAVSAEEASKPGHYRLEANYTDRGAESVPALTASTVVYLRPRHVEAESADEINGPMVLGSGNASAGRFIGAINHGHVLRFRSVLMDDVRKLLLRIASAGSGGSIEVRLHQPDGPLLASTEIMVNGDWEKFYDRTVEFDAVSGRHDLIVRFTHPGQAGGLMNLDSIDFLKE